jgi:HEAT repeat protein
LNGKKSGGKTRSETLKMRITNCELRITNLRGVIKIFALICLLCAFAGKSFTQDAVVTQAQIDWLAAKTYLEQRIKSGGDEQKRDALFRIRNLESTEASLLAVPALRDKSEIVRATAAFSVIFLPKDAALNVLLPLLNDKKELVRHCQN